MVWLEQMIEEKAVTSYKKVGLDELFEKYNDAYKSVVVYDDKLPSIVPLNAVLVNHKITQILIEIESPPDPPEEGVNGWVRVSIKDQGPGIEEKDFEIIFDRFVQVSPEALYDKPKGTGLGLSICKEIIAHYGGRIGLMSEKGKGCSFFFTLPTA